MTCTVLVIGNEPAQRNQLTYSLQNRLGYRTASVSSEHEALQYFGVQEAVQQQPDLILLDWHPVSEMESLADLKTLCAHVPVVVLVKYGDYDTALKALAAGAQDFFTKPVAMERISTTFRNLLLLRDMRREVEWLRHGQDGSGPGAPAEGAGALQSSRFPLVDTQGNMRRMEDIEADAIRFAMQYYHGRMTEVARRLGIGRSTLYRKLSELSIRQTEAA